MPTTAKVTLAEAEEYLKTFDWTEIDAMTDEDIARQVAENPDAAPLLKEGEDYSAWRHVPARAPKVAKKARPAVDVGDLRRRLGMTQAQFARAYHFNLRSLQAIEIGRRHPTGATRALLELIAADPDYVRLRLAGKWAGGDQG